MATTTEKVKKPNVIMQIHTDFCGLEWQNDSKVLMLAAEEVEIPPNGTRRVRVGMDIKIPEGYHLAFTPYTLMNDLIDKGYTVLATSMEGTQFDVKVPIKNPTKMTFRVYEGETLVSVRLVKNEPFGFRKGGVR